MDQADNPNSNGTQATKDGGQNNLAANGKQRAHGNGARPFGPEELRVNFNKALNAIEAKGLLLGPDDLAITDNALRNLLEDPHDLERYLEFISGIPYMEDMSEAHIITLLRLLKPTAVDGTYLPSEEAQSEAVAVINMLDAKNSAEDQTEENKAE